MRASDIPIPKPCHEDWDAMRIEDRKRYCERCREHVHDLSALSESEARALLRSRTDMCVSYELHADGTIRFAGPASVVPVSRLRRVSAAVAPLGLATALAACAPHDNPDVPKIDVAAEESVAPRSLAVIPEGPAPQSPVLLPEVAEPQSEPAPLEPPRPRLRGRIAPRKLKGKIALPRPSASAD